MVHKELPGYVNNFRSWTCFCLCKMGSRCPPRLTPPEGIRSGTFGGRARDGGHRPAASRPPRLPVGLGANRTRTAAPGSVPRLASRRPTGRPKAAGRLADCSSLFRSTAMWDGSAHVGFPVHHFRGASPSQSVSATEGAAPPLKGAGLLTSKPTLPPPPRAAAAPLGL